MRDYNEKAHELTRCLLKLYYDREELLDTLGYKNPMPEFDEFELYCATYEAADEFILTKK